MSHTKCSFSCSNMFRLESLDTSAVAVFIGETAKPLLGKSFPTDCNDVLHGSRSTSLQTRRKSFDVARAILLRCFQDMMCSLRSTRSTLETPDASLRGKGSTLVVSCSLLFEIGLSGLRKVVTLNTPQSTLHTLHLILILHSTLYTSHFTLHTLHSTHYTPHFTVYTPNFAL